MADVVITHSGALGRQQHILNSSDVTDITLRNRSIKRIDLSELSSCNMLRRLDLSGNEIESIKLDSLSQCRGLKTINLSNNKLKEIDLYPLLLNRGLSSIDLSHNPLQLLDVTPIFSGPYIRIDKRCKIHLSLIYRYLIRLGDLSLIELVDSKVSTAHSPRIHWVSIRDLAAKTDFADILSSIQELIDLTEPQQHFRLQRGLMSAFGFGELGGYDGKIQELLKGIGAEDSLGDASSLFLDNAIELLQNQLQRGGSTLFLDLDQIKRSRASCLSVNIAKRRKKELREANVLVTEKGYDLSALCLTHYGFELINAMRLGLLTDEEGVDELAASFSSVGLELQTTKDSRVIEKFKKRYSTSLRDYVQDRVQFQGLF